MPRQFIIRKTAAGEWENVRDWKQHLAALPPGRYKVNELVPYKQRSLPQNAFYWGVVVPMVYQGLRDAGFDAVRNTDDAHEVMKNLFLKIRETHNGFSIERAMSTTELNTTGFMEYLLNIQVWAIDYLNISVPNPNEQLQIDLPHVSVAEYDRELNTTIIK